VSGDRENGSQGTFEAKGVARLVRDIPDYPQPGVLFKDITPLLADAEGFSATVAALAGENLRGQIDVVVGIEARGFILAAPVALELGAGFVPMRKAGKLPWDTVSAGYALEYGEAVIEIHQDAIRPGDRVLVVDDVLATGGTAAAAVGLVERLGGRIAEVVFLVELPALGGRAKLGGHRVRSLIEG
jgi:adenine phosphoribosyltransferase